MDEPNGDQADEEVNDVPHTSPECSGTAKEGADIKQVISSYIFELDKNSFLIYSKAIDPNSHVVIMSGSVEHRGSLDSLGDSLENLAQQLMNGSDDLPTLKESFMSRSKWHLTAISITAVAIWMASDATSKYNDLSQKNSEIRSQYLLATAQEDITSLGSQYNDNVSKMEKQEQTIMQMYMVKDGVNDGLADVGLSAEEINDVQIAITQAAEDAIGNLTLARIISFEFLAIDNLALSVDVSGVIDDVNKTINLVVPNGTDVAALIPSIVISGSDISPVSGTATDFSSAVTYVVTTEDGTTQDYTVTVLQSGFQVSSISGNTGENGTQSTFTVKLDSQPTSDVTTGVSSSNPGEGTVSPSSLIFTDQNWDTTQTVTVTGVADNIIDGDQGFVIELATASSDDPNFNGLDPPDVSVTNTDNKSAAGILDTTFSGDGVAVHNNAAGGNGIDEGYSIITDSNGKILVTGRSHNGSNYDMVTWRYSLDGSLDPSFDSDGYVVHSNAAGGSGHDEGWAITTDSNDKILVTGSSYNGAISANDVDMVIWRYNTDGSLDTDFDSDGYVIDDQAAEVGGGGNGVDRGYSITTDSNGKILVTGDSSIGSTSDMVIWRYNTDGSLDTGFDSDGRVVAGGGSWDGGESIVIDSDGKILVSTLSNNGSTYEMRAYRVNTNGSLDTSFDSDGYVMHDDTAGGVGVDKGRSIITDSNGKILVTGSSSNGTNIDMVIWRYNSDGSLDTDFDSDGFVVYDGGSGDDGGLSIIIDSNGKILVAGSTSNGTNIDMVI